VARLDSVQERIARLGSAQGLVARLDFARERVARLDICRLLPIRMLSSSRGKTAAAGLRFPTSEGATDVTYLTPCLLGGGRGSAQHHAIGTDRSPLSASTRDRSVSARQPRPRIEGSA